MCIYNVMTRVFIYDGTLFELCLSRSVTEHRIYVHVKVYELLSEVVQSSLICTFECTGRPVSSFLINRHCRLQCITYVVYCVSSAKRCVRKAHFEILMFRHAMSQANSWIWFITRDTHHNARQRRIFDAPTSSRLRNTWDRKKEYKKQLCRFCLVSEKTNGRHIYKNTNVQNVTKKSKHASSEKQWKSNKYMKVFEVRNDKMITLCMQINMLK